MGKRWKLLKHSEGKNWGEALSVLEHYPSAALVKGKKKLELLHLELDNNAHVEVVEALILADPKACSD
jgi:hypothetical protein